MADLKHIYKELKGSAQGIKMKTESLKSQEEDLRSTVADILGFFDKKKNIPDFKKVKSGLFVKAIEYTDTDKNKLEEDLDIMLSYAKLIKNGEVPSADINLYKVLKEELKTSKSELKELKKKFESDIDTIDLYAIEMIIAEELSDKESSGGSKMTQDQLLEKVKEIRKIVKG